MKKIMMCLSVSVTALLTGCITPYQPPAEGNTSKISFVPMLQGSIFVLIHEGDNVKTCTNPRQIAWLLNGEKTSTLVPADKKIVLRLRQSQSAGTYMAICHAAAEFTPERGKNYVFTMGSHGQCFYTLKSEDGPVQVKNREVTPSAISADTSWCKPTED